MKARAIWKGVLRFDKVKVPVNLYSAVVDRAIHFHLLHDEDMVRVQQRLVNAETNRTVTHAGTRKAVVLDPDVWVMLDERELAALEPEASRDITISRFVESKQLNHQWVERPYYLGPDGDQETYFAFAEALSRQDKIGIARWVMRKKSYLGAVRAEDDYLMLLTLRPATEVIAPSDLKPPSGGNLNKKEKQLAEQLVRALEDTFDPKAYKDEYQDRVRQLIQAKTKGKTLPIKKVATKPRTGTLLTTLKASLRAAAK